MQDERVRSFNEGGIVAAAMPVRTDVHTPFWEAERLAVRLGEVAPEEQAVVAAHLRVPRLGLTLRDFGGRGAGGDRVGPGLPVRLIEVQAHVIDDSIARPCLLGRELAHGAIGIEAEFEPGSGHGAHGLHNLAQTVRPHVVRSCKLLVGTDRIFDFR